MPKKTRAPVRHLGDLVPLLLWSDGFGEVLAALQRGDSGTIDGAWGSACALTTAALADKAPGTLLVVLPRISEVDDFADDVAGLCGFDPVLFPAWDSLPKDHRITDVTFGARLRVLRALTSSVPPKIIVTSIPALLQPVPSHDELIRGTRTFSAGDEIDPEELVRDLVDLGLEHVTGIEMPGEFSMHGGIVDIFSPDAENPLRLEFFGDELESIRTFDVETQRKLEDLSEAAITLVAPPGPDDDSNGDRLAGEHFLEFIPPQPWIALVEPGELVSEGKHYLERLDDPRGFYQVDATLARCMQHPTVTISALAGDSFEATCHLRIESVERFNGRAGEAIEELGTLLASDEQAVIACHNEGERERLSELIAESKIPAASRISLCVGRLTAGFRMVSERVIVVSDHELFHRKEVRRAVNKKAAVESRAIDSFLELSEGDLVVHLSKGIARFRGIKLLEKGDQKEEHLELEFHSKTRVYVPVSLIHLVQKYVGGAKAAPVLSRLGSKSWERKKQAVEEAVRDLAADMIQLQAARKTKSGHTFPADSQWQHEFEASFPYTETPDQLTTMESIRGDMQGAQPMDRLICGDVGYGKTEMAIRAAFKAVDSGKQVAVLVPTTVLAEQHFRTFSERMAEYPFNVDVLSRFKTKREQRETLAKLKSGGVDLVIGTHRLVQKDIEFNDLGLLIIDEEQRFGVAAKEMLKRLRLEVDVLTMSATPIPRTLHMSLVGIRDISNLETPPRDRQAVETRICRFDGELIRQAIIREMNRGGQIYFVHNRVYNIQSIADQIQSLVPEARIGIVHGQMKEGELEPAMLSFVRRDTDVLVATTIIESGLDIPNANTIFIHQADNYGLADLHQLRGRVGRYKNRAYCYLVLEEGRSLSSTAAKRLKAIEEFSELGAGFKIAMRDLEIRGSGNILGNEQSGHIASVGYELYCQLLENCVRTMTNQPLRQMANVAIDLPISAYLPGSYVPPGRAKIEVYRRLSRTQDFQQLAEFEAEVIDRFGPMPVEAKRLLELRGLQLMAHFWQIDDIHLEDRYAVFCYRDPKKIQQLKAFSGNRLRIADGRSAYLPLVKTLPLNFDTVFEDIVAVLRPGDSP
ncbi:Transcription-repair-coupling factor [Symmachiella macrocystis]|uniref:Transcription-repair-coupling factor n=1 Tax=Symmachiella macrocystis TaxID=2527985 RepID=A0A5C6BVY4_9PLAN|nr:transcription-repair coupling factor [Symmachiella macrocystis]TWU14829.1 Transcription-repair-coupling factor [Symmachiella macrocystis]